MSGIKELLERLTSQSNHEHVVGRTIKVRPEWARTFAQLEKSAEAMEKQLDKDKNTQTLLWATIRDELELQDVNHLRYNAEDGVVEVMECTDEDEPKPSTKKSRGTNLA